MDASIDTPRLCLVKLTNTDLDSQHLHWFHTLWTDTDFTAWSVHGVSKSLQDSRDWMLEQATRYDAINYAVFAKNGADPGVLVGNIGLRLQEEGPLLAPPSPPDEYLPVGEKKLNLRTMGYGYFKSAWGKGYATEAGRALVEVYKKSVGEKKSEEIFYIEARVHVDNPASIKVLEKVGFKEIGWKEDNPVFLAGKMRQGYGPIHGLYV
ncbi:acyl-CoA N-acyltransferase [Corynespora cassiicola Philippines]|uniref:Acyl-CoA N-acyltransferase n=1 Tax=Corynespora cassiicola Philippines TaxID=1448308 RepID=A0A2T2P249_CORCC|nr:acyl-CoA N-acyltransferase [Corynespora cassiicola Philippines]